MLVVVVIMFFATIMYYVEADTADTQMTSIPAAAWWCFVAISSVGYGDLVPVSNGLFVFINLRIKFRFL